MAVHASLSVLWWNVQFLTGNKSATARKRKDNSIDNSYYTWKAVNWTEYRFSNYFNELSSFTREHQFKHLHWIPKRVAQVRVPRGHFGILHWDTFSAHNFQKVPLTITWKYENSLAAISWVSQKPISLFSNAGLTRSRKELPAEQSCLISEVCDPVNVCGLFQRIILSRPLGLLQYARSECYKHHASEINWNVMTNNKTMSHLFIFLILEL